MKQPMKGGERKAGVYVLVSVCVFLGVAEVQRSHLARMQGSSLFFLQRKGKEEGQAKKKKNLLNNMDHTNLFNILRSYVCLIAQLSYLN